MQLRTRPSLSSVIAAISSLLLTLLYLGFFTSTPAYIAYALATVLSLVVFGVWVLVGANARDSTWHPSDTQTHPPINKTKHK